MSYHPIMSITLIIKFDMLVTKYLYLQKLKSVKSMAYRKIVVTPVH